MGYNMKTKNVKLPRKCAAHGENVAVEVAGQGIVYGCGCKYLVA